MLLSSQFSMKFLSSLRDVSNQRIKRVSDLPCMINRFALIAVAILVDIYELQILGSCHRVDKP